MAKLGTIIADFRTALAAKMAVGATTGTLQSATDDDGVALPAGRYFFTIDGDNSQKEHISCELSGTALTSVKSVSRQGVETSGTVREHRVGASVVITNFAHIKYLNDMVGGDLIWDTPDLTGIKSITGTDAGGLDNFTFVDGLTTPNSSETTKAANIDYVNNITLAGAADASTTVKGIVKLSSSPVSPTEPIACGTNDPRLPTTNEKAAIAGLSGTAVSASNKLIDAASATTTPTASKIPIADGSGKLDGGWVGLSKIFNAGETINGATLPVAVYQNATDNEIYACDGNDTAKLNFLGFAISNGTDGNPITVRTNGIVNGFIGLVEGSYYYVQDDKTIGISKGTYEIQVGIAISETELLIEKKHLSILDRARNSYKFWISELKSGYVNIESLPDAPTYISFSGDSAGEPNSQSASIISYNGSTGTSDDYFYIRAKSVGYDIDGLAYMKLTHTITGEDSGAGSGYLSGFWGWYDITSQISTRYSASIAKHVGFYYDKPHSSASKVYASCADGSAVTNVELVGISANTKHSYEIEHFGLSVNFYIDGILLATITTNIPTVDTANYSPIFSIFNESDGNSGNPDGWLRKDAIWVNTLS